MVKVNELNAVQQMCVWGCIPGHEKDHLGTIVGHLTVSGLSVMPAVSGLSVMPAVMVPRGCQCHLAYVWICSNMWCSVCDPSLWLCHRNL